MIYLNYNTVTPVRLEPTAPRSQVKHSTTELLCSLDRNLYILTLVSVIKSEASPSDPNITRFNGLVREPVESPIQSNLLLRSPLLSATLS